MKLATLRVDGKTVAARLDGDTAVELDAPDVGALLTDPGWRAKARTSAGVHHDATTANYAPVVPRPGKFLCVGLNYRPHILEMGRDLPEHPTVFAKFPEALIGANDDIALPAESTAMDWEGELAVVIGSSVRRASREEAAAAIAGFSVVNDVTARDWQYRTTQWLQGKTFERTTPIGPVMVVGGDVASAVENGLELVTEVDGDVVQKASTADLVFGAVELVQYLSRILTLRPGDVIATGTPGGVGHARKPPRYLRDNSTLVTRIAGIGELRNVARAEQAPEAGR